VARSYGAVLNVPTWNPVARQIAAAQDRSLGENARAFALLNMAMTDALLAVVETKYRYTFWRPETAIAAADTDDNPRTDPDFRPFIATPCHPSYGSGHAATAGAAQRVLERLYGPGTHAIELWSRWIRAAPLVAAGSLIVCRPDADGCDGFDRGGKRSCIYDPTFP
jgi:membrane-associated phospholipid phosphatase